MRPQDLAAAITQVVGQSDDGVSVEALQRAFPDVARRTLQRYLARLTSDGKLIPVGRAGACLSAEHGGGPHGLFTRPGVRAAAPHGTSAGDRPPRPTD